MKAVNITAARQNLYSLVNDVSIGHEPVQIIGKTSSAILISLKDWEAISETIYLNSVPGMADSIIAGAKTPVEDCLPLDEADW